MAVFHQSTFANLGLEGLSQTLGVRYDHEKGTRDYMSSKNNGAPQWQYAQQKFDQVIPKVALQYIFPVKGQIYGNISKGYKTGGFNTSFNEETEKCYGPENSWHYEIGVKHPFGDKRFLCRSRVFLDRLEESANPVTGRCRWVHNSQCGKKCK